MPNGEPIRPTLEDAIALAAQTHRGQVDKGGQPYILHVLRVMLQLPDEDARITAMLHDVVEDSTLTLADLARSGYPPRIVRALDGLTRRDGEDYMEYIRRLAPNPIARRVKMADLRDNSNRKRHNPPTVKDVLRAKRYRKARRILRRFESSGGNPSS
jgi:(p)ppGpp synthase/HD superfamily hydrolase